MYDTVIRGGTLIDGSGRPGFNGDLAIREGRWKLLVEEDGSGARLYDVQDDPGETVDLAEQRPELTRRLAGRAAEWWRTLPRDAGPPRPSTR